MNSATTRKPRMTAMPWILLGHDCIDILARNSRGGRTSSACMRGEISVIFRDPDALLVSERGEGAVEPFQVGENDGPG